MKDDQLLTYCQADVKSAFKLIPEPYWVNKIYSFGKYIKKYGYYPSWMPLCVYTDHGINYHNVAKHELEADAPTQLVHSPKSKALWEKLAKKPCYVMYSPFVFYRRQNNISTKINALGTIAFPAHSTPAIDDISDTEEYIKQLLEMPEKFQPISVCLHTHDIKKGKHHYFKKHKIPVYTAGNYLDDRFTQRFYDIIKNFKYATSNMVGSYLYYCVEMGIPFSIYGNKQLFINKSDPNIKKGLYDPNAESQSHRFVHDLFSGLFTDITQEQKDYVETALGLRDGISRGKMAWVLYSSFLKWIFSGTIFKHSFTYFQRRLKKEGS